MVSVKTDLSLSGAVAQYGRASGLIQDVASQLVGQFANALKAQLAAEQANKPPPPPPKPVSGFSLIFKALWNAIRRMFGGAKS